VSLRLVQYYFGTEEELLLFATQRLAAQFAERALARINRLPDRQVHRAWTGIFNEPLQRAGGQGGVSSR
jgi:AcrR family transcriptional regulator